MSDQQRREEEERIQARFVEAAKREAEAIAELAAASATEDFLGKTVFALRDAVLSLRAMTLEAATNERVNKRGTKESACKTVIGAWMKGAGLRWKPPAPLPTSPNQNNGTPSGKPATYKTDAYAPLALEPSGGACSPCTTWPFAVDSSAPITDKMNGLYILTRAAPLATVCHGPWPTVDFL